MLPHTMAVSAVLKASVRGLAAFVKQLSTCVVSKGGVPGLAAMEPTGDFVRKLNEVQPGQPDVTSTNYYAVTSEFVPHVLDGQHEPKELAGRFVQALAAGFVDQLLGQANDLVVDTNSMTEIDPQVGSFVKDVFAFGKSAAAYHLNYFTRPEVTSALTRWLQLHRAATNVQDGMHAINTECVPMSRLGSIIEPEVPVMASTDILVTSAAATVSDMEKSLREASPSFVVVQSPGSGEMLYYAFTFEEILQSLRDCAPGELLMGALPLYEDRRSSTVDCGRVVKASIIASDESLNLERQIVLKRGEPVGVVPKPGELPANSDLVTIAAPVLSPQADADRFLARRVMPMLGPAPVAEAVEPQTTTAARRGGIIAAVPAAGDQAPTNVPSTRHKIVECTFAATMDDEVIVHRVTTVEVIVSREDIKVIQSAGTAVAATPVDPTTKLILQVIPTAFFETVGENRGEFDPPAPGAPLRAYFDLRPTQEGQGEVWVVARQHGQVPLLTLTLKPKIVNSFANHTRRITVNTVTDLPPPSEPLHQLTIIEQLPGSGNTSYLYTLDCRDLGIFDTFESKRFVGDRSAYVNNLYKEIESRWIGSGRDAKAFNEDLRAYGAQLFEELFPENLQQILWHNRDRISSIMVISTEPFVPWEIVHLKQPNEPLSDEVKFLGQLGLVRWLYGNWSPETLYVVDGHARYVVPDYPHPDWKLPQAQQEIPFLKERFGAIAVEPEQIQVRNILQGGACDLLHFAGHGTAEQGNIANARIMLQGRIEGANYVPDWLDAIAVKQHAKFGARRPIVVLNACQIGRIGYQLTGIGGFAKAFLERGAGAFVGSLWSVGDHPAYISASTSIPHSSARWRKQGFFSRINVQPWGTSIHTRISP
jgi:hypothetical protein